MTIGDSFIVCYMGLFGLCVIIVCKTRLDPAVDKQWPVHVISYASSYAFIHAVYLKIVELFFAYYIF